MVSKELIQEFQDIAKAEYGLDLSFKEASKIGNDLVDFFDTLARIDFENSRNSTLQKWIFMVAYKWHPIELNTSESFYTICTLKGAASADK